MKKGDTTTKGKAAAKPRAKGKAESFGSRLASRLQSVAEALQSGEPLENRLTVRTVVLDLTPRSYAADDVKAVRAKFGASQSIFAQFLGVNVQTLQKWEHGQRSVPAMAARYLDDLQEFPEIWSRRIKIAKG
ncbi:helix-turn-helix domain-containing protein [Paludisphaera rhizosphaerae]|uniref:helix-turn-helix domain-containing protein n=1 Tax=Paludisphaera rhizosphaerae TaxID=2711216 RepID=UPI0013EDC68F|nr:hypothetical protein [Paludisphaera rhizosphaerae]